MPVNANVMYIYILGFVKVWQIRQKIKKNKENVHQIMSF